MGIVTSKNDTYLCEGHEVYASTKLKESKIFDNIASNELELYRSPWFSVIAESENKEIMDLFGSKLRNRIFECGCGIGDLFTDLSSHFETVFGCDISRGSLRLANATNRSALVVLADAENLPLQNGSFDAIVIKATLHHVSDVLRALLEAKNALCDQGVLIMAEPCGDTGLVCALRNRFSKEKHFQSKEIEIFLSHAGFKVATVRRAGFIAYAFGYLFRRTLLRFQNPLWFWRKISKMVLSVDNTIFKPFLKKHSLGLLVLAYKSSAQSKD